MVSLPACTVLGPDYEEPTVNWLQDWQPTVYNQSSSENPNSLLAEKQLDLEFWWQLFNDPILNQLIKEAKEQNHSLRIAGLRIFESRALLGIANSSLYPQLQQLNGNVSHVSSSSHGGNSINKKLNKSQSLTSYLR